MRIESVAEVSGRVPGVNPKGRRRRRKVERNYLRRLVFIYIFLLEIIIEGSRRVPGIPSHAPLKHSYPPEPSYPLPH